MNRTTLTSAGPYISAGIVTATENCRDGVRWHVKFNKSFKETCHFHHVYPPPTALLHSLAIRAGSLREEVFIFVQELGLFLFSFFFFFFPLCCFEADSIPGYWSSVWTCWPCRRSVCVHRLAQCSLRTKSPTRDTTACGAAPLRHCACTQ